MQCTVGLPHPRARAPQAPSHPKLGGVGKKSTREGIRDVTGILKPRPGGIWPTSLIELGLLKSPGDGEQPGFILARIMGEPTGGRRGEDKETKTLRAKKKDL